MLLCLRLGDNVKNRAQSQQCISRSDKCDTYYNVAVMYDYSYSPFLKVCHYQCVLLHNLGYPIPGRRFLCQFLPELHSGDTSLHRDDCCRKVRTIQPPMLHTVFDDVIKWKHFLRYWSFVRGIHRSPVNSPHKGQWRGALVFSLTSAWTNGWVNSRGAGDLRRNCAHYDVIEIWCFVVLLIHVSLREISIALGKSYDCPLDSEVYPENMQGSFWVWVQPTRDGVET